MKRIYLSLAAITCLAFGAFGQTTLTVDANGVLNFPKIVAQSSSGQIFFTGHQLGSGYGYTGGIFRAITDNATGSANYFYDGVTNGVTNFSVRADGQAYFAGKIGLGTTAPNASLDINGGIYFGSNNLDGANINFMANSAKILTGWNRTSGAGETDFISNQGPGSVGGFAFYNHNNSNAETQLMWILGNGQVLIGNTQGKQGNYMLAVAGSAVATSMTVKLVSNWPDYVLKQGYQLPSLAEIKTYIGQNHHLPEVPSEQQIAKDGLNLGEMNMLLTKKVEELTLYLIEKDEQISEQQKVNQSIQRQLNDLVKQLKALNATVKPTGSN